MSMRITDLRLRRFRATQRSTWMFLEVETEDGLVGTGECSDSGWPEQVPETVGLLAPRVRGTDALAGGQDLCDRLRRECAAHGDPRTRFLRRTVIGGLDMALADLAAQAQGVPLWQWMGGERREDVPVYANINRSGGRRRPQDFAVKAAAAVADGHGKIKVAPFDGPPLPGESIVDTGLAIARAVREAIGEDAELMIDVHHKLSEDELAVAVPRLDDLGVAWLEDAVDVTDPEAMRWLAARAKAPIAGGETLHTAEQLAAALSTGHLKVLLLDPKYTAGVTPLLRLAERVTGVDVTYHNPCGPISTAVCAHLSTVHPGFTLVEYMYGEDVDRAAVVSPRESVTAASLPLSMAPGLGVALAPGLTFLPDLPESA
ncbi:mandelate racemase/muconate lactonizing enzyme family protein [Nonomuraea sp. NBC_00507]|uniref:mandelate racemase/muconate lactonizing enzyme family protein n=1 Tax=Nonomuraea sp. NBC_00507 TaxID=2976002 RepID=UPI002E199543